MGIGVAVDVGVGVAIASGVGEASREVGTEVAVGVGVMVGASGSRAVTRTGGLGTDAGGSLASGSPQATNTSNPTKAGSVRRSQFSMGET